MITGAFLDEITRDLPCANWGPDEWKRDFAAMRADGIDTVVLTRCALGQRAAFDSTALRKRHPHLIVGDDHLALFLSLARDNGMALWVGTYESDRRGDAQAQIDTARRLADEVWERCGRSSAFRGWYLGHATDADDADQMRACREIGRHLKQVSDLPILIAPPLCGLDEQAGARTLEQHTRAWDAALSGLEGVVDVLAFRDGGVEFDALPEWHAANAELARKHGTSSWTTVEAFDRGVPFRFPPTAWPKLRFQMETALAAGAARLVAFEYSRFLSPNSILPAAHMLHRRYREWLARRETAAAAR